MAITFVTLTTPEGAASALSYYVIGSRTLTTPEGTGSTFVGTGVYVRSLSSPATYAASFQIYKPKAFGSHADAGSQFSFLDGRLSSSPDAQSQFTFNTSFLSLSTPASPGSIFSRNTIAYMSFASEGDEASSFRGNPEEVVLETPETASDEFTYRGPSNWELENLGTPESSFTREGSTIQKALSTVASYVSQFWSGHYELVSSVASYSSAFEISNWELLATVAEYVSSFDMVKTAPINTIGNPGSSFVGQNIIHKEVITPESASQGFAYYVL